MEVPHQSRGGSRRPRQFVRKRLNQRLVASQTAAAVGTHRATGAELPLTNSDAHAVPDLVLRSLHVPPHLPMNPLPDARRVGPIGPRGAAQLDGAHVQWSLAALHE